MNVRRNESILRLLGGDPEFLEPSSVPVPNRLSLIATGGFNQTDRCVVFRLIAGVDATRRTLNNSNDETGIEAALSEINIEQFLYRPIELTELSRLGLDFGFLLKKEMTRSGLAAGPFRVIVSAQPADPPLNLGATCTVRLHRQRERQVWLDDDLKSYKDEAVAFLDF
jgi:hypothetical protein